MLMDSKGKLFGKVSIVDIVIVLLIVAAIVGAYFRFHGKSSEVVANDAEFYYVIKINNIQASNKDMLLKSIGTPFELFGKVQSTMGELIDVKTENAVNSITKNDGTIVNAEIPERFDVTLQFKVLGKTNEYGYFTPEMHEISAGKEYNIKNKYCCVSGMIQKVWSK